MGNDDLLKKIKAKNWYFEVSRKFCWLFEWGQITANSKNFQKKYTNFIFQTNNSLILNGDEYYLEDELTDFSSYLEEQFSKDNNFFENFYKDTLKLTKKVEKFEQNLKRKNFSKFSNEELAQETIVFGENLAISLIPAWTRPDLYLDSKIKEILPEESLVKISFPSHQNQILFFEEPLALLKIAQEIERNKAKRDVLLKKHLERFGWMKNPTGWEETAFNKEDYLKRIEAMMTKDIGQEIKEMELNRKIAKEECMRMIKEQHFDKRSLKLCQAVRDFSFLRTYTREVNERFFFVGRQTLFKEIAQRLNISNKEVLALEPPEVSSILIGDKIDFKEKIAQRRIGFAIIWLDDKLKTIFGQEGKDLQKEVFNLVRPTGQDQKQSLRGFIKGIPASKGKVVGKVKIILDHQDANKVNRGDILVATMTTPDFIFAMERAAAFVTDEGGITCHAAIVAREFGVPCIVGTQNATKTLKDGDLVEVNADDGIVKLIKN